MNPASYEIILAIDPSLRGTGYAVVGAPTTLGGGKPTCHEYGVIKLSRTLSLPGCLLAINTRLEEVIQRQKPGVFAIESTIFVQSYQTAILLGSARGAALLAAARYGLCIHEFAPKKIKQAVVGKGAATKNQVAFMVRAIFRLEETPPPDAADALAVALAYIQGATLRSAQTRKPTIHPL